MTDPLSILYHKVDPLSIYHKVVLCLKLLCLSTNFPHRPCPGRPLSPLNISKQQQQQQQQQQRGMKGEPPPPTQDDGIIKGNNSSRRFTSSRRHKIPTKRRATTLYGLFVLVSTFLGMINLGWTQILLTRSPPKKNSTVTLDHVHNNMVLPSIDLGASKPEMSASVETTLQDTAKNTDLKVVARTEWNASITIFSIHHHLSKIARMTWYTVSEGLVAQYKNGLNLDAHSNRSIEQGDQKFEPLCFGANHKCWDFAI
jgi:hypothetical protein